MIGFIVFTTLALTSQTSDSPYAFEVKNGFAAEVVTGGTIPDQLDNATGVGGLRLTYLPTDKTDAIFTGELQASVQRIFTSKKGVPLYRFNAFGGATIYEIYNPWALRASAGPAYERRGSVSSYGFYGRVGLGRYFTSHLGFYVDASYQEFYRKRTKTTTLGVERVRQWISTTEIDLSAQWIF